MPRIQNFVYPRRSTLIRSQCISDSILYYLVYNMFNTYRPYV